ncbi:class I SAM-dependent methyltransferase [Winogradskyella haliclonae]|uniref:Methyltransferase domain-containing protein n=1 Tax=Winogradskyella haliclonae TaxID=2048558 RepID=A0ABQ2C1V8_9FLAO|nr:class I SAM-dependent methyltransferase [Winogradskyella haliclonae]GGI58042.1 hypothetical protein GCM10011444_23510 [Winogradskyella haliclonae]
MSFNKSYIGLRPDILALVSGKDLSVLDVGCANGVNGAYLLDHKIASQVVGIELDDAMAKEAKNHYQEVFVGNLDDKEFIEKISSYDRMYDLIILGDVLEHLKDSKKTLMSLLTLLKQDGRVIFSLPNVQHIDVLKHIFIKGIFPRNDRGIFDKTHLQWFTLKNIEILMDASNLKPITIKRNFRFRDAIGSKFPFYGKILKKIFPNLYTFQYVVLCEKNA